MVIRNRIRAPKPQQTYNSLASKLQRAGVDRWESNDGKLDFGPSQPIFYDEFDGRWHKRVLVKILSA